MEYVWTSPNNSVWKIGEMLESNFDEYPIYTQRISNNRLDNLEEVLSTASEIGFTASKKASAFYRTSKENANKVQQEALVKRHCNASIFR